MCSTSLSHPTYRSSWGHNSVHTKKACQDKLVLHIKYLTNNVGVRMMILYVYLYGGPVREKSYKLYGKPSAELIGPFSLKQSIVGS